ncbi:RNA polymerase recycling motor ATPase HelR [Nocardioides luteus]|uniref:AAA family ATPase n=1 Tax=Nocardioides luteus TaxID=1844 RepID=A0A1J4N7I8_9ACTN|nr:RNA polymerase recycling motor ATPase HelR [Nocardioides luteus]OIJ26927.1 AAA family ATPase [Nocardioides luteus]
MQAFDLAGRHDAKADPALIADDERHFAAIGQSLEEQIAELNERLDDVRRRPGGHGQEAMDRDLEVHRIGGQLRMLRRFSLDLCLGRIVTESGDTIYIGRLGLTASDGRRLLVDWRSPAAAPFFAATHADPRGLLSRRRYRWTNGRVTDYWDEVFTAEGLEGHAALDDQSAFIATLGSSRSPRMRDVLGTIQSDQDAIIRASSRGALVVDGGPGTGKTVVALHRTAYLLYSDPRLGEGKGGVLFVGPHEPYLSYVADVLPSLGEEGVRTTTLRRMIPEGASLLPETDQEVARLKADARMVAAIEPAVALYEKPPSKPTLVETPYGDAVISVGDWAEAIAAAEQGTPHNDARDQVWDALLRIVTDKIQANGAGDPDRDYDADVDLDDWGDSDQEEDEFDAYGLVDEDAVDALRASLETNAGLLDVFGEVWPRLRPADIVGDLWEVPAFLRMCAPWLTPEEVKHLQRDQVVQAGQAWTEADLPLLDAAHRRLGDPDASRRRSAKKAAAAADRKAKAEVVSDLISHDDSEMKVMSMLRGQDVRTALLDDSVREPDELDPYAGPFAHIVVDEAQELTDAEWQMLISRCPSRSFTIVGDRAQARHGFTESWQERLERVGLDRIEMAGLSINYRTPEEVMAEAEPVIRAALPDANVPTSIRASGIPVLHGPVADLDEILDTWLAENAEGIACVIAAGSPDTDEGRVRRLSPEHAKGLEFDLVVLIEPETYGTGIEGAVDRYVAMTRATQKLAILR